MYRADPSSDYQWGVGLPSQGNFVWRPSIHMPRWASRITLEITEVRVQRVQEISEQDARAEGAEPNWYGDPKEGFDPDVHNYLDPSDIHYPNGCECGDGVSAQEWFAGLWDKINAKRGFGWDKNPWVWCLTFKRIK